MLRNGDIGVIVRPLEIQDPEFPGPQKNATRLFGLSAGRMCSNVWKTEFGHSPR